MPLVLELVVVKTPVVGTSSTPPLRVIGPRATCTGCPLEVTTSAEPKLATRVAANVSLTGLEALPLKASVPPLSVMPDVSGSMPPTEVPAEVIRL